MQQYKVSVIVPVYNAAQYLQDAIDDLLMQSLQEFEIIFVNDGSIDESEKILENAMKKDARVKIINQENHGAGAARNTGLRAATGEYLLFLDADDRFEAELLEKAYEKAVETKAEIVVFEGDAFDCVTGKKSEMPWLLEGEKYGKFFSAECVLDAEMKADIVYSFTNSTVWNKLFLRKFVIANSLLFQEIYAVDCMYFVMIALVKAKSIAILQRKLVHYRKDNPSGQIMNQEKNPLGVYEALKKVKDTLEKDQLFEKVEKEYICYAFQSCCTRFHFFHELLAEKMLYDKLHDGGLEKIGIVRGERYIRKELFQFYQKLKTLSYEEYRFEIDVKRTQCGLMTTDMYAMPDFGFCSETKIILYGAGNVGKSYFIQLMNRNKYKVVGWVDKQYKNCGYPVGQPEKIADIDCDAVIIAVLKKEAAAAIKKNLIEMGIPEQKIYWEKPEEV